MCDSLGFPLGKATVKRFSDGEIFVEIEENVRGADVFVVQSTCCPVNDNLMELLIMMDALKRASAKQDYGGVALLRLCQAGQEGCSKDADNCKLVADLITTAGADRILCMDLHAGQIQGFFNIPVDHLYATPVILDYIKKNFDDDIVIVSPDAGGVERARAFAKG